MIIDGKTMNEKGKKQRMFQWRALPSPKMPWETFKRMITMERFSDFTEMERPNEVLRVWRSRMNAYPFQPPWEYGEGKH